MSRRVFLDIGAHLGETLDEVVKPEWAFDEIVCFEPASSCWPMLEAKADQRVVLERFGLWNRDEVLTLHDAGAIGASLSAEKSRGENSESVQVRDGSAWFETHVQSDDVTFVKINIEGAECDLIERLFTSGELGKVDHLMVHFDVRKIPSMRHRVGAAVMVLDQSGIDWIDADKIMFGRSHALKTRNWLLYAEQGRWGRWVRRHPVRLWFRLRQMAYRIRTRLRD